MPYDPELADRVRAIVGDDLLVTERRMFGGLAFLVNGHLAVAASGQGGLLVRVDPERTEELTAQPGVARMVMKGREMDGWLRVAADSGSDAAELRHWVHEGMAYAGSLPPK